MPVKFSTEAPESVTYDQDEAVIREDEPLSPRKRASSVGARAVPIVVMKPPDAPSTPGVEGARNSGKEVPPKRPSAMEEIFSLAPGTMPLQNWGWENMACVEKEDTRSATAVARNSIDQLMLFGGNLVGLKKEVSGEEKLASKFVSKPNKKKENPQDVFLRDYVSFVPRRVLPELPSMHEAMARCQHFEGVVSFVDLAGFTKLTERLALQSDGAERLAKIINKLMGQMVDTLKTGDVIKFSGDAILVLYEPDRGFMSEDAPSASRSRRGDPAGSYEDLPAMRNAAYRAVSEGLKALFDDYTVPPSDLGAYGDPDDPVNVEGIKLALHVAITAGRLELMHVGGVFDRWEVVMAGEAMHALAGTADRAPTDWCTVDEKCWALLDGDPTGNKFDGVRLGPTSAECDNSGTVLHNGDSDVKYVRVKQEVDLSATSGSSIPPLPGAATAAAVGIPGMPHMLSGVYDTFLEMSGETTARTLGLKMVENMLTEDLAVLRRYVSPVVRRAIAARTMEAVSGFTDVSVLFVGISGVDLGLHSSDADMLWGQIIMSTVQECVYDHEGAVNKFVMDDKGALLLCAWGLPPMAHTDDPHRATAAAIQLAKAFDDLGVQAHIGVTTGKVFAGVIGPPHRCEFSLLGDTVNLAARLMGKAPFGGVLCDESTYESAKLTMEYDVLEPIKVKGKEALIPIFRPVRDKHAELSAKTDEGLLRRRTRSMPTNLRSGSATADDDFGSGARVLSQGHMRQREREELVEILDNLYSGSGGMLLVSGDAGSGKSELAKMVLQSTENYDSRLIESLTPKNQGNLSKIKSKPCVELSQILQGLLTPEANGMNMFVKRVAAPQSVDAWRARLKEYVNDPSLDHLLHLYDAYFLEWLAEEAKAKAASAAGEGARDDSRGQGDEADGEKVSSPSEARTNAFQRLKSQQSVAAMSPRHGGGQGNRDSIGGGWELNGEGKGGEGNDAEYGDMGPDSDAAGRLTLLSAILTYVLDKTRPLMIFIHVRTGSSLSANAVHPEMWPLLAHLSNYATRRHDTMINESSGFNGGNPIGLLSQQKPLPANPLVVAFTHRRILDYGGRAMNQAYAQVVENADQCGGLLQLDPLDDADRERYLCLSLQVSKVPLALSRWVSDVANGNPQYIEICAEAVDKPEILTRVPASAGKPTDLACVLNGPEGAAALQALAPPPKIVGFIKQTLGSLGPQDKLVVQVLSLFKPEDASDGMPLPTMHVVTRAYAAMADEGGVDMVKIVERLALYGLVVVHDPTNPPDHHHVATRVSHYEADVDHRRAYYYTLNYRLLQTMAAEGLLAHQRKAILQSMEPPTETR